MVLSRSTSASARSSSPRVGSSPLIQSTKCWVGRTLRAERLSSFMVVSSTSKRRPLWVLAAGFTNASRAEPPTTELGSENSGRPALPGEWRPKGSLAACANAAGAPTAPFARQSRSPTKTQRPSPQNPGALPTKTQRPSPQNPGAPHTRQPAGAASLHLWPHGGEQQHIADRGAVGQQHHQAVDADALAGGGRQAVFQGTHVVGNEVHRLVVAGPPPRDL